MPITAHYPRTLLITAQYCPLRDEGVAYAERLANADIPCQHPMMANMIHAFLNLEDLAAEACRTLYQRVHHFFSR